MRSFIIVEVYPLIQIGLEFGDGLVELLAECDLIKLLQDGLVEALADAVGLGRLHFGFRVVNVVDRLEELVIYDAEPIMVGLRSLVEF